MLKANFSKWHAGAAAAIVLIGTVAFGAFGVIRPSGADGASLVWLDLGPVDCTGDVMIDEAQLAGYHTYRLYVRMEIEDSVNLVATGASAKIDDQAIAPMFFPETQPFQHPAGGNAAPTDAWVNAAAEAGICLQSDSYFVLGAPRAQMYFINEPSPQDWGEALDVVWLGIPKQFGQIDEALFGDAQYYAWIMQITIPPGTPINGQFRVGFGDKSLGTRMELDTFDVPPLPILNTTGRSELGGQSTETLDANDDRFLGIEDVAQVLKSWGRCARGCQADIDGNRKVDHRDLAAVLRPIGLVPEQMDKAAWRDAVATLNEGPLSQTMPFRKRGRIRKDLKRLYKAIKG